MTSTFTDEAAIVSANDADIKGIQSLLNHYASLGNVLPRTKTELRQAINHFVVAKNKQDIVACGALEFFSAELAEIRSLVVSPQQQGTGLGKKLLDKLIEQAGQAQIKRLMALTYVPGFFHQHGFITVDKAIFPEKIWGICVNCYKFNNCDEIAVLKRLD